MGGVDWADARTPAADFVRVMTNFQLALSKARGVAFTRPWLPLALGLLIVVLVGFVSARSVIASQDQSRTVQQALQTVTTADAVRIALLEMSNAERGYVLNRNARFLERYRGAKADLQREHMRLVTLLPGARISPRMTADYEDAYAERVRAFFNVEQAIARGDLAQAGTISAANKVQGDRIRAALNAVKAKVFSDLDEQRADASESFSRAIFYTVTGLVAAAMLIVIAIILLARRSADLQRANSEIRDLAESLEQRVKNRTAALEEANEEIQRFAYIVSHDLRSPLVNIMGFTAELEEAQQTAVAFVKRAAEGGGDPVPADVTAAIATDMPEAMGFIRAATARMDRLIKAILQISREGRRSLVAEPISLDELFAEMRDTLAGQLEAADATLSIGPLPQVVGDRLALEQVFGNLLDNAIKYLRPGVAGRITVTAQTSRNMAFIRIHDNGRGVAVADQKRIFELFRRAGVQDQPGEGIGLAHVQALLRRLGGQITLESTPDEGCCFTVSLPLIMAAR